MLTADGFHVTALSGYGRLPKSIWLHDCLVHMNCRTALQFNGAGLTRARVA